MKLKEFKKRDFSQPPWIGNIILTYWRFLLIYSIFILFILGITDNLKGYTQTIIYLFLSIFPWGYIVFTLLELRQANNLLHNWSIYLKDYKTIAAFGEIDIIGATKTAFTKQPIRINTILMDDQYISITGQGYEPRGEFFLATGARYKSKGLNHLLRSLVLVSDTWLVKGNIRVGGWFRRDKQIMLTGPFGNEEHYHNYDEWSILGSPIEGTFLATGAKGGIWREDLEHQGERLAYIPFEPNKRWSAAIFKEETKEYFYINGDPQVILSSCQSIWKRDSWFPLSVWHRKRINATIEEMTREGLKVLCVAYTSDFNSVIEEINSIPNNLILLGLVGVEEWPEMGINTIIKDLKNNGIEVNLVSGDDFLTVNSFAQTMPIKVNEEWCRLTPKGKGHLVNKWSSEGKKVMVIGTKSSDLEFMSGADVAFCYMESDNNIKDYAQGILPRGNLENLVIGINICRNTKHLLIYLNHLTIIVTFLFGILILAGKYIFEISMPWWFWAITKSLIIMGIIILPKAKRRLNN